MRSGWSIGNDSSSSAGVVASPTLVGCQRRETMPGLRGDHDARAASSDDVPELFKHESSAVQMTLSESTPGMPELGDTPAAWITPVTHPLPTPYR